MNLDKVTKAHIQQMIQLLWDFSNIQGPDYGHWIAAPKMTAHMFGKKVTYGRPLQKWSWAFIKNGALPV